MTKKSNKRFIVNLTENIKSWLAARSKPSEPTPYVLDVGVLEDRVLYSATAMPIDDVVDQVLSAVRERLG